MLDSSRLSDAIENVPAMNKDATTSSSELEGVEKPAIAWLQKLAEVNQPLKDAFVTGSRLLYRGKTWYCMVEPAEELSQARISFNHSRFFIRSRIT